MDELYTLREVATMLQVPLTTVYRWRSRRELPGVRIGKHIRITKGQLEAFIAMRTERPASAAVR